MGRGVSAGGGQSSLGYLFGNGEVANNPQAEQKQAQDSNNVATRKSAAKSADALQPVDNSKLIPAGINSNTANNHGHFLTDRPSTKVQAAPGGGSSLGYLFGGSGN
ncbi:hypothetical protein NMG60_11006332 [Bertholletia excelsa]